MKWNPQIGGCSPKIVESCQITWNKSITEDSIEVNFPALNKALTLEEFITVFWKR